MATENAPELAPDRGPDRSARRHFLLRRLHSLTGIVPIGVFLVAHLVTNSSILWGWLGLRGKQPNNDVLAGGVMYFQKEVTWISEQIPHLLLIEIVLWASIAFHAILGFAYARSGRSNVASYSYSSNWRYTMQRATGYIAFLFILYHVATLRWGWTFMVPGNVKWSHEAASSTLALALRGGEEWTAAGLIVALGYFVGITASVFHFANGLWTSAITWGITLSAGSQRRWGYACAALGAGLMAMAWGALAGFLILDLDKARAIEREHAHTHSTAYGPAPAQIEADRAAPGLIDPGPDPRYPWPGAESLVDLQARVGPLQDRGV